MSNKSRLQTNNINLQELIDKANALPDAGSDSGGGNIATCNVYIIMGMTTEGRFAAYTTLDASGNMVPAVLENCGSATTPLVCVCNTPLTLYRNDNYGIGFQLATDLPVLRGNPNQGLYVFTGGTEANTDYWIRFIPAGSVD